MPDKSTATNPVTMTTKFGTQSAITQHI